MNNTNKIIEKNAELTHIHEELRGEILNNPELSQEFKNQYIELIKQLDLNTTKDQKIFEEYQEKNKGKKIIAYNLETFWPIYEI